MMRSSCARHTMWAMHVEEDRPARARSRRARSWPECRPRPASASPAGRAGTGRRATTPPITQASANTVATTYEVLDGRRCSVCRIWPIDCRSSLAARGPDAHRRRFGLSNRSFSAAAAAAASRRCRRPASRGGAEDGSSAGSARLRGLVGGAQDLLDRRQGLVRRVLHLLRVVRHVGRRLTLYNLTPGDLACRMCRMLQAWTPRVSQSLSPTIVAVPLTGPGPGRHAFLPRNVHGTPDALHRIVHRIARQFSSHPIGLAHRKKRRP